MNGGVEDSSVGISESLSVVGLWKQYGSSLTLTVLFSLSVTTYCETQSYTTKRKVGKLSNHPHSSLLVSCHPSLPFPTNRD